MSDVSQAETSSVAVHLAENRNRPLCPLCGEREPLRTKCYYDREQKLFQCLSCEMVFRAPLFGEIETPSYDEFYQNVSLEEQREIAQNEHTEHSRHHVFYDYVLSHVIAKCGTDLSLLEVGCGPGNFLDRAAAMGIHRRTGIDPQNHVVEFIRSRRQHNIVEGYYSRESFPPNCFGFIYHSHVLEHVEWPVEFLKNNYYHLSPGGVLVVRVPSVRSPEYWVQVLSNNRLARSGPINPQHIVYFTPRTLTLALRKVGYEEVEIQNGLWAYKRPKFSVVWRDPLFKFMRLGDMLAFACKPPLT